MKFIISSAKNGARTKDQFDELLVDYPSLSRYSAEFDRNINKSYVFIREPQIFRFLEELDEDAVISIKNAEKNIIIYDGKIE